MGISSKHDRRNDEITATQLRVINDKGEQLGILDRNTALEMAAKESLDLVEVSPNAEPPVAKIMDYGKYQFQKSKSQQVAKKKQKQIQVKEIKFRPGTDIGDYKTKLNKLIQFLEGGDKVKITLRFRGREMAHQELGLELLQRVKADLDELGVVEQEPKSEGRLMVMVMAPRKAIA